MSTSNINKGTFLKNGGNRYFMVTAMDGTTITFEEYNGHGPTGKTTSMGLSTFNALYKNKNYRIVRFVNSIKQGRWIEKTDLIADRIIGANRYMIKQY